MHLPMQIAVANVQIVYRIMPPGIQVKLSVCVCVWVWVYVWVAIRRSLARAWSINSKLPLSCLLNGPLSSVSTVEQLNNEILFCKQFKFMFKLVKLVSTLDSAKSCLNLSLRLSECVIIYTIVLLLSQHAIVACN